MRENLTATQTPKLAFVVIASVIVCCFFSCMYDVRVRACASIAEKYANSFRITKYEDAGG